MADNKLALERMLNLCDKLQRKELDFITFIDEFEKICFNDVSANGVKHFADGYTQASVSTLMRYVLRAYDGDKKAMRRLEVDLEIEDYDLSNDIEVIHI
ncbi:MAG: hypothetical protein IJ342_00655 [Muribaculaceae bacterium]|nr:hypothetical protein [Muribaculaceae bacterium]